MMKKLTLPLTYYDVLKKNRPALLFDLVAQDVADLEDRDDAVGSAEELSHARMYVEHVIDTLVDQLRVMVGDVSEDEIRATIASAPEFDDLTYQAETDYLTAFNFERFGRKTFFVTRNLAEHLAQTQLNIASEYVRAPFKTSLFVFTDAQSIEAFYRIAGVPPRHLADPLNVFVVERPTDAGLRTLIFFCVHAGEQKTHNVVKRQLLIREGWDIEKMLATDWADIYELGPDAIDERRFIDDGLLFFRIVLNVLLYLGSSEPDLIDCLSPRGALEQRAAQSAKWKKLRRKAEDVSELPFVAVGSNIGTIDVAKPSPSSEPAAVPAYRIGTRFVVRGHWRQQPFGPSSSRRKLIWIKPYYKGPEMAELINRPYVVR